MPFIEHIYYEEAGAGRPVIFLHCPAVSHIYWRPVMKRLESICRCIAIDIRGHGKSGKGDDPWTFQDIAADVALLTRQLSLDRPVLVGYSAGGVIAMQATIRDPGLYGGIVAVGPLVACDTWNLKIKLGLGLFVTNLGLVRLAGRSVLATNSVGKEHTRDMLPDVRKVRPTSMRAFLRETQRTNLRGRLHAIDVPVLLIYGTLDDWMHGYYREFMRELPKARGLFFDGVDHRVPTARPDDFADAVARFLSEIDDRAGEEGLIMPPPPPPGAFIPPLHP